MRPITLDARRVVAALMTTFVVAGLIQLKPAQAADEPLEVLAGGEGTTSEWVAYSIRSNGGQYQVKWTYEVHQDPFQIGAYFYTGDDVFTSGFTWTAFTYQDSSHYEVNVVPGKPIAGEPTIDADGYTQTATIGGRLFGSPEVPKLTKVLIWASGDLTRGSEWELTATPDAHLVTDEAGEVVMTSGTNAFVHLSEDFEGAAKAGVQRRVPSTVLGSGAGVRAATLTSKTVEVNHALIGAFMPLGAGSPFAVAGYTMQVSGPDGERNCATSQCVWRSLKAPEALRAGTYRFDLTGGGAGIGTFGDTMLWGVDAHLPAGRDPDPTPIVKSPSVVTVPGGVNVSGQASFPSTALSVAADPEDDGEGPAGAADVLGAELSGGSVTYFPDEKELLMQWDLSTHEAGASTFPGVLYAKEFLAGGTRYEVRVLKPAATSSSPSPDSAQSYFALFRCAPECTEQTQLQGWYSWPGRWFIQVEVPLSAISADEGSHLTDLRSFTAIGEASPGALVPIDEMSLPSAVIPESRVELGLAPASTPEDEVVFDHQASLSGGEFTGGVSTEGLSPGSYRLWTRACLGTLCGSAMPADVTL